MSNVPMLLAPLVVLPVLLVRVSEDNRPPGTEPQKQQTHSWVSGETFRHSPWGDQKRVTQSLAHVSIVRRSEGLFTIQQRPEVSRTGTRGTASGVGAGSALEGRCRGRARASHGAWQTRWGGH